MKSAVLALVISCVALSTLSSASASETGSDVKWYFSPGIGIYDYEGDQQVTDGFILSGKLGYDWNETWSLEGVFTLAPSLDVNEATSYGESVPRGDFDSTWGASLALDGLFHFTRWERLDPYLALGAGFFWFGEDLDGDAFQPAVRAGGGVMYHINDMWSLRADARVLIAGSDTEANSLLDVGLVWRGIFHQFKPEVKGPKDSDGDRLTDDEEIGLGTDPMDPDTDNDKLRDGDEVLVYKSNPLVKDTDLDGLQDGAEVHKYKTSPTKRDSDNGGVTDGHEVVEDKTDPTNGADDLVMFELNIEFDYDKAVVKPQYFSDLDVIGKMLLRNPDSTAKVEGHADQKKGSKASYNKKLSLRRAKSVMNYLSATHNISAKRLEAEGFGFSRPKVTPDLVNGNPENRRVEIYLRGIDKKKESAILDKLPENK